MKMRIGNNLIVLRSPVQRFRLPTLDTWGITNKVGKRFLLFWEYDNVDYDVVTEDVKKMQVDFNIGHVLVRISSLSNHKSTEVGSYHCYSFYNYSSLDEVIKLVNHTRCDDSFKRGYRYQARCFVLRVGEKMRLATNTPQKPFTMYKELILQKHDGRCKLACNALIGLFEKMDNISIRKHFRKVDNSKELEFIRYWTR